MDGADVAQKPSIDSSSVRRAIRLRRGSTGATSAFAPETVSGALHSPGQPLEATTRQFMEHRFGHDFSRVRIHADSEAAESARSVGALAYTVGRDVVFGAGRYQPRSFAGRQLIAHELAHVVQQNGSAAVVRRAVTYPPVPKPATKDPLARPPVGGIVLASTTQTINGSPIPRDMADAVKTIKAAFHPTAVETKNAASAPGGSGQGSGSGSGKTTPGVGSGSGSSGASAVVQCGFKDFDVKISATKILPTPPSDGRWVAYFDGSNLPASYGKACSDKTHIPYVLKGKPDTKTFYQKVVANEEDHVTDLKDASKLFLEPHYMAIMAMRGSGPDLKACQGNLNAQLDQISDDRIRDFHTRQLADIQKHDAPGRGHVYGGNPVVHGSCDRIELILEHTPTPGGTQAPPHGQTH
jgi:hypothetical protein